MPKVSVIIPTYNCAKYLSEAIQSVLNQTYQDFEIIVVDDGSTDETKQILNPYIEKNLIRYVYQNNQGPGAARNKGIEYAKGRYIAFLDADDILFEGSFQKRINFLKRYPEIEVVFSDYMIKLNPQEEPKPVLREKGILDFFNNCIEFSNEKEFIFTNEFYYQYFLFSPLPISTITVMARQETIRKTGLFRTDIKIGEDVDYWLRLIYGKKVGYINEELALYHHYSSGLSKDKENSDLDGVRLCRDLYCKTKDKRFKYILRKRLAKIYFSLGHYYKSKNNFSKARQCFLDGLNYSVMDFRLLKSLLGTFKPFI